MSTSLTKKVHAVVLSVATAASLTACTIDRQEDGARTTPAATNTQIPANQAQNASPAQAPAQPAPPAPTAPATPAAQPAQSGADLNSIAAQVQAQTGTQVGIAVNGQAAGTLKTGPAWSTSKVPLSIAALRANPNNAAIVDQAIRSSDNASAEQLWESLGGGAQAAAAVQGVIAEGGDTQTVVQSQKVRPEFSAFGQTVWSLANQSTFASNLANIPGSDQVLQDMAAIAPDQAYGLGQIPGTRFKGGWGPNPAGAYLVRQLGIVNTPCGPRGVAIAAQPASGTYASGQQALNALASALSAHMTDVCR